jgi:hypothetical protein
MKADDGTSERDNITNEFNGLLEVIYILEILMLPCDFS